LLPLTLPVYTPSETRLSVTEVAISGASKLGFGPQNDDKIDTKSAPKSEIDFDAALEPFFLMSTFGF